MMENNRRKFYLIKSNFHKKIFKLILFSNLALTLGLIGITYFNYFKVLNTIKNDIDHFKLMLIVKELNLFFLIIVPLLFIITVTISLYISNKATGPLLRVQNEIANMLKNKDKKGKITFRKSDNLTELEQLLNTLKDKLK